MATGDHTSQPRLRPKLREEGESRVTPLELFFDLVFVLAITQCTALMSHDPTWSGLAQGLLVLGMRLVGVGRVRLADQRRRPRGGRRPPRDLRRDGGAADRLALRAAGLRQPGAGLRPRLRRSSASPRSGSSSSPAPTTTPCATRCWGSRSATAIAVSLLIVASLFDGLAQGALWALALFLDLGGAYLIPPAGWKLVPEHFAERHGLIVIIALGESIVAIGVGAAGELSFGIGTAAVLGVALAAAMWWIYFDIVALVSGRRLAAAEPGRVQNAMARDSYSYLHLPMVAGIVLVALGLKKTIGHFDGHLDTVLAFALLGGVAIYLLALVAFRYRHVRTWNTRRLVLAIVLLILVPVAVEIPAIATLAIVNVLLWALIALRDAGNTARTRQSVRHPGEGEPGTGPDWPRALTKVAGSGPVRSPESRPSNAAISASVSSKSKMSMFSRIRSGVTDFGKTMLPSWMCQRRIAWAGVFPCAAAIGAIVSSSRCQALASGLQASVAMPCSACQRRSSACWSQGWSSTWLTVGRVEVSRSSRSRSSIRKLETPIVRAPPSSWIRSKARQVSTKRSSVGIGQWIR